MGKGRDGGWGGGVAAGGGVVRWERTFGERVRQRHVKREQHICVWLIIRHDETTQYRCVSVVSVGQSVTMIFFSVKNIFLSSQFFFRSQILFCRSTSNDFYRLVYGRDITKRLD